MKNLENHLWSTALQLAGDAGMEYTVPCSRNLRDLIASGAGDMRREGRVSEEDLEKADGSLSLLVGSIIRTTQALGFKAERLGKIQIREDALVQAKKLCPLWPFG